VEQHKVRGGYVPIERSKGRDKRQQGAIRILMRHEREQHRKRRLNNILEEYDQVLAEPAATEREQKKQRLEDLPGDNDQMLAEATAAHDEDGHGDGGGDCSGRWW